MLLIGGRTCWSAVEYAEIVFALVTRAIITTDSRVPDHINRVVRDLAAALAPDLDDCSYETLTAVFVLRLPVTAPYDAESHLYITTVHGACMSMPYCNKVNITITLLYRHQLHRNVI